MEIKKKRALNPWFFAIFAAIMVCGLVFTGCSDPVSGPVDNSTGNVAVTGVTLAPTTETVDVGAKKTLTAAVAPTNATDKTLTWSTSDGSKATVNNGVVTGVAKGTATITVITRDGKKTATCLVTVNNPGDVPATTVLVTGVTLNETGITLTERGVRSLTATVLPDNASDKNVSWSSSATAIATVDATGKVTAVAEGSAIITVTTDGLKADGQKATATCAVTVNPANPDDVPVTGVTLNKTQLSLIVGGSETLTHTIAPSNATNKNVSWSSSDATKASVNEGLVTAHAVGTATITVTTEDGGITATCMVTVNPVVVTGVTLNQTSIELMENDEVVLTATVQPDTANQTVSWSSGNGAVATVVDGTVTAVAEGSATITVTTEGKMANGQSATETCTVTVIPLDPDIIPAESVSLNKTTLELPVRGTETLVPTVLPSDASNKTVSWSSNNAPVASVVNGLVTAHRVGSATITVTTHNGKTAICIVTVVPDPTVVASVGLNQSSITLKPGASETLTATVLPSTATTRTVTWRSNNDGIATVVNGLVTAVSRGTATITVTTVGLKEDGEAATATCAVTVEYADVVSVSLNKASTTLAFGGSETLTAEVLPATANQHISWSVAPEGVVTVVNGLVTAISDGTATVTVTTTGTKANGQPDTATCEVTVEPDPNAVSSVTLNKASLTLQIGDSETLTATVLPGTAPDKTVTWISSDRTTATVNASGRVTGFAVGTATITATSINGKVGTCMVFVEPVAVTGVTLDKKTLALVVGATETLNATVAPVNAGNKAVSWSSNSAHATVNSSTGLVTAVSAGEATITVTTTDGEKTDTCEVTVSPIAVSSVSLDKKTLTLGVNGTGVLIPTVLPPNAANKAVSWESSNPEFATVSNGTVTGVAIGTANITVTTEDGSKTDTCVVTVVEGSVVTGITLNKSVLYLARSATEQLIATVYPETATNKNITWTTSSSSRGTVSATGLVTAASSAQATSTATITARTADGNFTATCTVYTVNPVTSLTLDRSTLNLVVGETTGNTLTATAGPTSGTQPTIRTGVWSSDNEEVASVVGGGTNTLTGTITAKKVGTAIITVSSLTNPEMTASCTVTVNSAGVTLDKKTLTLDLIGTGSLTATVTPANAVNKAVTWSSSRPEVATVAGSGANNATGTVTGVADGQTIITVTTEDGNQTDTCVVTVIEGSSVTGITLNKSVLYLARASNATEQLIATVYPETAINKNVIWTSSNTSRATVSDTGLVTALGLANTTVTTITAKTEDGGFTATCTVYTVTHVSSVTLNRSTLDLAVGATTGNTLSATVTSVATFRTVTWTSSNEDVATVAGGGTNNLTGTITAKAAGSTIITVSSVSTPEMTASCTVTVYSGAVTGVTLNNETLALGVNGTGSLTATVMPANAINKAVNWSSSRPEVATVAGSGTNNLTGTVTGVANGQTTITVTTADGGFTATCVVTVTTVFVTGVTVSPTAYDLMSNYLLPMDATVTPTNAYNRNVTWSSSNPDVVFISDTSTSFNWGTLPARRAYARSLGTATITATTVGLKENGQPATASCVMNVVPYLDGFVTVPAGTFQMGSPTSESGRSNDETQHTVTISKGFYMSESPVTQAQYMRVMGYNPSFWDYRLEAAAEQTYWSKSPADSMTWFDAIEYCNNLSVRENLTPVYTINNRQPATGYPIHGLAMVNGEWDIVTTVTANWSANGYRLPTEAEWELACRAGTRTAYNVPDRNSSGIFTSYGKYTLIPPTLDANFNITDLGDANFDGGSIYRSIGYSLPVKEAYDYGNYYGLYGMHGNVTEWCWDAWDYTTAYAAGSVTDPKGLVNPPDNYPRVMRGGSYAHGSAWVRSAKRDAGYPCDDGYEVGGYLEPLNGFRVVRNYAVTGGSSSPSLKTLPQSESAPKMVGGTRSMESIEWSRMVRKARTVPQNKRVIDKFIPPMKRGDFRKE